MGSSSDFNSFGKRMVKIAAATQKDVDIFVRNVVVEIATNVAGRTPVDEGVARSNWVTRLTYQRRKPIPAYAPFFPRRKGGPGGSVSEGRNLAAVREQAQAAVSAYVSDRPVYITNDTDYIIALNGGSSRQAPAGFVQAGIARGLAVAIAKMKFDNTEKV